MSKAAHEETLKNVREWDVMMTTGELFPNLDPKAVRNIHVPVLLLSGEKSYPFLGLIDEELARLLVDNRRIILPGATHRMWFEQPDECRKDALEFLRGKLSTSQRRLASPAAQSTAAKPSPDVTLFSPMGIVARPSSLPRWRENSLTINCSATNEAGTDFDPACTATIIRFTFTTGLPER